MKGSIQQKLLGMGLILVLITTLGISTTYYVLTKRDKQRESRQRIQIAFDIILDDFQTRVDSYKANFDDFLSEDVSLKWTADSYNRDKTQISSAYFMTAYLAKVATQLKNFGSVISANRMALYGLDKRLLVVSQNYAGSETFGIYVISSTGENTYLSMEDPSHPISSILLDNIVPDNPLPSGIAASYQGDIPDTISVSPFYQEQQIGIRIIVPVYRQDNKIGVLISEIVYTKGIVERYASLSKTDINFFAGDQLSVGTFPAQTRLDPGTIEQMFACEDLMRGDQEILITPVTFGDHGYYQGQCALKSAWGTAGAITVSLSQAFEQQEIRKVLTSVLTIALLASGFALGLSVLASRSSVQFIQHVIRAIDRLSKGDLPEMLTGTYTGEFKAIQQNLNLLIEATNETTRIAEEISMGDMQMEVRERSEHDRLMQALNRMIRRLNDVVRVTEAIAAGNLAVEVTERSEQDRLMLALKALVQRLNGIVQEMEGLIHAIQSGQLDTRGQAEAFAGGWRELVQGVNRLITAFVEPINVTAAYIEQLSQTTIPDDITAEYNGDFNKIKTNLNRLSQDIRNVLHETTTLSQAIQAGNLAARGNEQAFGGGWRELVGGVNSLIEAFVAPITLTGVYLDRIARGDIPDPITTEYAGDFNTMKQNLNLLIAASQEITQVASEMAEGNLTVAVRERSAHDVLIQALNMMIARLQETVTQVQTAGNYVAVGSRDLRANAEAMSQGVSEQAAASEEASSSMEQITANIHQSADNAQQTDQIAKQAAQYAEESGKVVAEMVVAMQQIVEKTRIIEDIATQTRMLSLNATIEASRAQEYGKAFSVVAAEVRQLSTITKSAAEEINQLASSSLIVSERAGQMLATLLPSIHKTAELVQEISASSQEQSSGVQQINTAIQQLDQVTQQNAITSESVAAAAEELAAQAEQLRNAMQFFKTLEPELYPSRQMPLPAGMPVAQRPQGLTTLRGERARAFIQRKGQGSGVTSRSENISSQDWVPWNSVAPTVYAADKPLKIAYFVSDLNVAFHQAQAYWAKIYAKENYGADVHVFDGKSDNATMLANLNQLVSQGMDMATLHIWQVDAAKPGIEAALKAGITMASFFGGQAVDIPVVRHDEASVSFQMGKIAAEQWKKAFPHTPIVFVELGWIDNKAVVEGRTNPFIAGVLSVEPVAKNLGCLDASKGAEAAKNIIQDVIRAHPDLCIIYSEAANLTDGTIPGLKAVGRGKMKNGVPLTEIVASVDCPENEIHQIYNPNSSLKMSLALPPKETGMFRIDNLMDIRNGKIPQVDRANKKAYYIPASLISYWNMKPDEAIKWYNDEFQANIRLLEYKFGEDVHDLHDDEFERY